MTERIDINAALSDLAGLIAIKSVKGSCGEVNDKYPLGKGIGEAISYTLSIGEKMGFKTVNLDNTCGYVEAGRGDKLLGILVHVDTVEADGKWDYEPYKLTVTDDKIYGRGVADNKGAAILVLHCMKYLNDNNLLNNKRVRLIIGGDEEAGEWECIKRYKKTEETPDIAFSPDGDYPVVFAEKGILRVKLSKECNYGDFVFEGGRVVNMVPDFAKAVVNGTEYSEKGISAHAMEPHKGENAILKLAKTLENNGVSNDFTKLLLSADAKKWSIEFSDRPSGVLTLNPSVARVNEKENYLICDIRYPVTVNYTDIIHNIEKSVEKTGYKVYEAGHQKPLYVDKNSHLVSTLLSVYNELTGKNDEPVSMGGGTYARAFDNAVAFGMWFPDTPSCMHKPNEYFIIDEYKKNFEIITEAIKRL